MYINIAAHYVRSRQVTYVREAFQSIIRELIDADELDLEADPVLVGTVLQWILDFPHSFDETDTSSTHRC